MGSTRLDGMGVWFLNGLMARQERDEAAHAHRFPHLTFRKISRQRSTRVYARFRVAEQRQAESLNLGRLSQGYDVLRPT
jgi:hypothetical protein